MTYNGDSYYKMYTWLFERQEYNIFYENTLPAKVKVVETAPLSTKGYSNLSWRSAGRIDDVISSVAYFYAY